MISTSVQVYPEVDSLAALSSFSSSPVQSTPSSFRRSDLSIGLRWRPQARYLRKGKTPASGLLVRTAVISLVIFGLTWVVWRCSLQLAAGRWRKAAAFDRSLAAGGEEDSSLCKPADEEEEDASRQAATGSPELAQTSRDMLVRSHAFLLACGSLALYAEQVVVLLTPQDQYRATSLLVSMIIVEMTALMALAGEPVKGTLAAVCSVIGQMVERVAKRLEPARIKGAAKRYEAFGKILEKLKNAEHPLPPLPEQERLQRLRELHSLQTLAQNQVRSAFISLVKPNIPVMRLDEDALPRSMIQLTHTAYARKHQVLRDRLLCHWLLRNEGPFAHSPVLPNAYLKFILQYNQPVYGELLRELTDPSSSYARHQSYSSNADEQVSALEQKLAEEGLREDAATDEDDADDEDEEDGQRSPRKKKEQRNSAVWPSLMDLLAQFESLGPETRDTSSSSPPAETPAEKEQTSESPDSTQEPIRRRAATIEGEGSEDVWIKRASFISVAGLASSDSESFYSASDGEHQSSALHHDSEKRKAHGKAKAGRQSRSPPLADSPLVKEGASAEHDSEDEYLLGAAVEQQVAGSSSGTTSSRSSTSLSELQVSSEEEETIIWGTPRRVPWSPVPVQESQLQGVTEGEPSGVQTSDGVEEAAATEESATTSLGLQSSDEESSHK